MAKEDTLLIKNGPTVLIKNGPTGFKGSHVASLSFYIGCYMVCSCGMLLVNKEVVKGFDGLTVTVTMIQMAFASVFLGTVLFWTLHFGSAKDALTWIVLCVPLFAGMLGEPQQLRRTFSCSPNLCKHGCTSCFTRLPLNAFCSDLDAHSQIRVGGLCDGVTKCCTNDRAGG